MKERFENWNPSAESALTIETANAIIADYREQGYTLTLRQLYYQFVARALIPNTERSYKNLGNLVTKARMAGMLDWEAIEDRNRSHEAPWVQDDLMKPIRQLRYSYSADYWKHQDYHVEVWVEKEALGSVVARPCEELRVTHMACKGYLSASESWRAGKRFEAKIREGKKVVILHLGDHDPSGVDMTRDNRERSMIFSWAEPGEVEVRRIALNMDQVKKYQPPPNPAKITDSRADEYIRKFGHVSWELDALEPAVIDKLVRKHVQSFINPSAWAEAEEEERRAAEKLGLVYERWDEISELLE